MSASNPHRQFSPVRACVLQIAVSLGVCAVLFGDEKPPVPSEWSRSFPTLFGEEKPPARSESSFSLSPVECSRVRTQRTQQPGGDDRVQAFYDALDAVKVEQKKEEDRKARYAQRRSQRLPSAHYPHQRRK